MAIWHVPPALFAWLALLVPPTKTHPEKQVLVRGTKQSKQDNKAGRLTRQADRVVRFA